MIVYDAWNRLVAVYTDDSGSPDDILAQYEYDGQNRLILRGADTDADGSLDSFTHYFYNDEQVIETRDSSSPAPSPESLDPTYQYVWSARYIDSPILRDANTDADGLCDDGRIYYLTDANANVTALTDASGTVIERYVYTPYGDVTIYDATWSNTRGSSSYDNTILFTGRELDPQTGLYNYRARWYHAGLGTFTTRDPLGFSAGDANLYRYVGGNPISRTDPSGMLVVEPTGLLSGGYSECPFGAYDWTDPNGNYVTIPGWDGDVFVPSWGYFTFTTIWCDYCGPWVNSVSVYNPAYNIWTNRSRSHFHIVADYSPGPSVKGWSWNDFYLMGRHPISTLGGWIAGEWQGRLNIGNGLTNIGIGIFNSMSNNIYSIIDLIEGGMGPQAPQIPKSDWSKGMITDEDPFLHDLSVQIGGTSAFLLMTIGIGKLLSGSSAAPDAPGVEEPKPPGWNENWELRGASNKGTGINWWDEEGGEWHFHEGGSDPWHGPGTDHWDYDPWVDWSNTGGTQKIPHNGG